MTAAVGSLIEVMHRLAQRGQSLLNVLFPDQAAVRPWTHHPPRDAIDRISGFRWYYHAHPGQGIWPGEHGHFHLFADPAGQGTQVTHLLAVSVDARGLPLGMLSLNRWVTGEHWQPAAQVLQLVQGFGVSRPARMGVIHRVLPLILQAFTPQIRALLRHRDRRLAELRRRVGDTVFDDRRITVLSRTRLDLMQHAAALEGGSWRSRRHPGGM